MFICEPLSQMVVFPNMPHLSTLAYLDGGTGSLMLQAALAGVLTAGYVVRTQWNNLVARFSARKGNTPTNPSNVK